MFICRHKLKGKQSVFKYLCCLDLEKTDYWHLLQTLFILKKLIKTVSIVIIIQKKKIYCCQTCDLYGLPHLFHQEFYLNYFILNLLLLSMRIRLINIADMKEKDKEVKVVRIVIDLLVVY